MYSSPAAPGGPWYPELKWFIPLYESYKYGQLFHSPSFLSPLAWVSQTGCGMPPMEWRIPLGMGRKRGVGFQVWVTVGRKGSRSCLFALWGWQQQRRRWRGGRVEQGPPGSFTPIITFTAAAGGLSGRTRVWNPMMYTPQARWTWSWMGGQWGGSCWILLREALRNAGCPARANEWASRRSLGQKLPPDAQKGSDKSQQSECNRLCSSHQSWVFSFSHSFLISEMIKRLRIQICLIFNLGTM